MKTKLIGLLAAITLTSCADFTGKIFVDTPYGEMSKDANVITITPKVPIIIEK